MIMVILEIGHEKVLMYTFDKYITSKYTWLFRLFKRLMLKNLHAAYSKKNKCDFVVSIFLSSFDDCINLFSTGLLGKVLMEDVRAKEPYPPFAASVKDGYAVIGNATF